MKQRLTFAKKGAAKLFLWLSIVVFSLLLLVPASAAAADCSTTPTTTQPGSSNCLSQAESNRLFHGTAFYDAAACSSVTGGAGGSGAGSPAAPSDTTGATSGSWNSGLQPPYTLEEFAIETLKDIAAKRGVPTTSTVTQEHVIALLAFMFGEGGDINNQDLFNPLNTGINAPDLLASSNAANGVQSFKSFDAGVEATARTMVGSNQSRLADVLTDPNSTAEKFMYDLTYFDQFPGNKEWAEASLPPNADSYYQQHLQLVQQVRSNYASIAGLILGTPDKEQLKNETDTSKLQFSGGTSNQAPGAGGASSNTSCACTPGQNSPTSGKPVIVLDPGHAPGTDIKIDPGSKLGVADYENEPEMQQVWDVAQQVKTKLEADGYTVILTKSSANDSTTDLKKRADVGTQNQAALGVSIHTSPGTPDSQSTVIVPKVGDFRLLSTSSDDPVNGQKAVYSNTSLATIDQKDGQIMADARAKAESETVRSDSYYNLYHGYLDRSSSVGFTMNGSMTTTQYFAQIPWLYNEQWQDAGNGSISSDLAQKYATGLINGIEQIVPINGVSAGDSTTTPAATCGSISCDSGTVPQGISATRQKVVCLAQQELQKWVSGQLTAEDGYLTYSQQSREEWCADFVSWLYEQAGYPLAPDPHWRQPAVNQIQAIGMGQKNFHFHDLVDTPSTAYDPNYVPKPGDLVIYPGQHVQIVVAVNGKNLTVIGGDEGHGPYPGGSIVQEDQISGFTAGGIAGYVSPD